MEMSFDSEGAILISGPDGRQYRLLGETLSDSEGRHIAQLPASMAPVFHSFCKLRTITKEQNPALEADPAYQASMERQAARLWAMLPIGRTGYDAHRAALHIERWRQFEQWHHDNHDVAPPFLPEE
jgi:hypothetical protein